MQSVKVCIILPSYNHGLFIRQAIESVLNQTYTDFHLIIWDDGSTDQSWEIISDFTDPRIQSFKNPRNQTKVINEVISGLSDKYEYIAIHHSDDIWEREKLEKQVAFLDSHPKVGAVFTHVTPIDQSGHPLGDASHFYYSVFDQPNRNRHEWLRYFFLHQNALCHPSILIRKACYDQCGQYNHALIQLADFDMWVRLVLHYEIHVFPEKLVQFRIMDDEKNTSGNRKDVRIRANVEFYMVLQNYGNIHKMEDLVQIFPEANKYNRDQYTDVGFAMGMTGLELTSMNQNHLFCYGLMFTAMNDPHRRKQIDEHYGFNIHDFKKLSESLDIFGYEEVKEMQMKTEILSQSLLALQLRNSELTQHISNLESQLMEVMGKFESTRSELDKTIKDLTSSVSWQITKPLRVLKKVLVNFFR